jgi:hypothetical protein
MNEFQKKQSGKCVEILESVGIGGAIASHGCPKLKQKGTTVDDMVTWDTIRAATTDVGASANLQISSKE